MGVQPRPRRFQRPVGGAPVPRRFRHSWATSSARATPAITASMCASLSAVWSSRFCAASATMIAAAQRRRRQDFWRRGPVRAITFSTIRLALRRSDLSDRDLTAAQLAWLKTVLAAPGPKVVFTRPARLLRKVQPLAEVGA